MPQQRIAIVNPKGGVGKTTTTINLATLSALADFRTLVIDFDTQQSSSLLSRTMDASDENSTSVFYCDNPRLPSEIAVASINGYDIIPATGTLVSKEKWLTVAQHRELKLRRLFKQDKALAQYDRIFFDTPAFRGALVDNVLMVCTGVVIPLRASELSMQEFLEFIPYLDTVNEHRADFGDPPLVIMAVVFCDVNERTLATQSILDTLCGEIQDMADIPLAPKVIPSSTDIEVAAIKHAPVVLVRGTSKVAVRYIDLYNFITNETMTPYYKQGVQTA